MITLVYELVDQPEVEHEREFSSRSEALLWVRGMRETDFEWIEVHTESWYFMAESWSDLLGGLNE